MALGRRIPAVITCVLLAVLSGGVAAAAPPPGYPVSGIDVSAFQGPIDWTAVAAGGAKFAYIRASEQADIPDSLFYSNYQAAKANGLYAGAYHRARPDVSTGRAQADDLIDHAGYVEDGRTLPPMLDIEWPRTNWPGLDACYNLTPAQLSAWIRDFVDEVTARTGRLAMIYTNPNWWNPCTGSDTTFGDHPLFNSGYVPNPPPPPAGWTTWTLWQYANSGSLPGDQDVFNGDFAALARLAGGTPFGLRAHANGRYVSAENAGASPLVASRTAVDSWERLDQIDGGGGYVALRSHANGMLVSADNAGNSPLVANRSVIGPWERFKVILNTDGSVSLQASVNGRYVTAEHGGGSALIANRAAIGPWEQFDEVIPPAPITLRADINHRYVTADNAGAAPLIANRAAVGLWEQFDQVDVGGGYLALRAKVNSRYVAAENAGASPLVANRLAVGPWERFRVVVDIDASISLLAQVNSRYVTAGNAGASPLVADRPAIGPGERFKRDPL